MPVGQSRDFHQKHEFVVEIDGVAYAGFMSCSEISGEANISEYREGGSMLVTKKPGIVAYTDVTLERGATLDRDLFDWFKQTIDAGAGRGETSNRYKRNLDVVARDRDGSDKERWTLYGAFVKKFSAGEWDATDDGAVINSVVLAYDYFDKTL